MKILKYVVVILVLLFVGFFLIGVFVPKFSYESHVVVNASLEKSWAIFTDSSKMGEWMPGFKSIENISGEEMEVGSEWKLVVEDQGEVFEMIEKVTAVKEQEKYAFGLDNDFLNANVEVHFAAIDSVTTKITETTETIGKNVIKKSLLYIMKAGMLGRSQETYNNLKKVIETSDYTPREEAVEVSESQNE